MNYLIISITIIIAPHLLYNIATLMLVLLH